MEKRLDKNIGIFILVAVAAFALYHIPFSSKIDQEITAQVYQNGVQIGETAVVMEGEKTNYLFQSSDNYVGSFYIELLPKTGQYNASTQIWWTKDYGNVQHMSSYISGSDFIGTADVGLVSWVMFSEDMTSFAVMLTDGTIVATSQELADLCAEHITYDNENGITSVTGEIPEIT